MVTLEERLGDPGFSPRKADAPRLFELLGDADRKLALSAERALARLGGWAGEQAAARLPPSSAPLRGRLCRLLGRAARHDASLRPRLLELLEDDDAKTRRNAIIALGKLQGETGRAELELKLLERWDAAPSLEEQRSLTVALGKLGGAAALERLAAARSDDPELSRLLEEARLKIGRTLGRLEPGRLDATRPGPGPLQVVFHCRAGLEELLVDELGSELAPRRLGPARVLARWSGKLERLQVPRIALRFGFPLPAPRLGEGEDLAEVLAGALAGAEAQAILRAFTVGPIRFRLEWAGAGHRRALTFRVAAAVLRRWPELVNDPTRSLWEVVVREAGHPRRLELELWPRGLEDRRFVYRRRDLPAASHPTIAAALARLAGVREDDLCWDPFVGSGTELVERGLLGPYARLVGSDSDPLALEAARENLTASGLARWELQLGDARQHAPPARPSLIVTNPPLGRRLKADGDLPALLARFLGRAAELLLPSGRLAWICPFPRSLAPALGPLRVVVRRPVDLGGFRAELQLLRRPD